MPLVLEGPADQLAGFDHLPELDDRVDVPVREVADPDDALHTGGGCFHTVSRERFEREVGERRPAPEH